MRWDPLLAAALARELDERLHGARLRALHLDGDSRRVHLFFREHTLVLELHPTAGWISLLDAADPFPDARPLASKVVEVRALPDESALVLGLRKVRGRDEGVELVAEWIGNRWNAAVVGHRSRIIRHVLLPREEAERSLTVGAPYDPPPSTGRKGIQKPLSGEEWNAILDSAGDEQEARRRALLQNVAWTSSLNVGRFLEPDGLEAWQAATDPVSWEVHLLETPRGLQPYPLAISSYDSEPRDTLLDAVAEARREAAAGDPRELLLPARILERARKRLRNAEGKVRGLTRELESASDPAPVRHMGDLILARYGEIPRGAASTTLTGFEGEPVEVELDPTLSPNENAKRYYDEAARLERARSELPARIRKAEAEAKRWRTLVEGLEEGTLEPADAARQLGPDTQRPARKGGDRAASLPYRTFHTSGGHEIRVGRGARHNDDLTFRHSNPDDIWLHARQAPGAHVILRWSREEHPPRRDLVEAAILAAVHSDARHSGTVPVDWTRRKYVRKPRKAAPGAVLPDRIQTLFVEPDPGLAERLSGTG